MPIENQIYLISSYLFIVALSHHGMPIIIAYIDSIMPYPKMDSVVTALIILYSDNIMLYAYMSYHSIIMVL